MGIYQFEGFLYLNTVLCLWKQKNTKFLNLHTIKEKGICKIVENKFI